MTAHPAGGPLVALHDATYRVGEATLVEQVSLTVAERGERRPDGRVKLLAYAVGCNPDTDPFDDWWELARAELGGDDFGEFFDPKEGVFARILHGTDDLMLSATATHLSLEVVPPA